MRSVLEASFNPVCCYTQKALCKWTNKGWMFLLFLKKRSFLKSEDSDDKSNSEKDDQTKAGDSRGGNSSETEGSLGEQNEEMVITKKLKSDKRGSSRDQR